MFGSQIHTLPDTNIYKNHKIESAIYTFSILPLKGPTVSLNYRNLKIDDQIQQGMQQQQLVRYNKRYNNSWSAKNVVKKGCTLEVINNIVDCSQLIIL